MALKIHKGADSAWHPNPSCDALDSPLYGFRGSRVQIWVILLSIWSQLNSPVVTFLPSLHPFYAATISDGCADNMVVGKKGMSRRERIIGRVLGTWSYALLNFSKKNEVPLQSNHPSEWVLFPVCANGSGAPLLSDFFSWSIPCQNVSGAKRISNLKDVGEKRAMGVYKCCWLVISKCLVLLITLMHNAGTSSHVRQPTISLRLTEIMILNWTVYQAHGDGLASSVKVIRR